MILGDEDFEAIKITGNAVRTRVLNNRIESASTYPVIKETTGCNYSMVAFNQVSGSVTGVDTSEAGANSDYRFATAARFAANTILVGNGASPVSAKALADFSTEAAPAAGDYLVGFRDDGSLMKTDVAHVGGSSGGAINAIINGGFEIWQRSTDDAAVTTVRKYVADRFAVKTGAGTLTHVRRSTTVRTGARAS